MTKCTILLTTWLAPLSVLPRLPRRFKRVLFRTKWSQCFPRLLLGLLSLALIRINNLWFSCRFLVLWEILLTSRTHMVYLSIAKFYPNCVKSMATLDLRVTKNWFWTCQDCYQRFQSILTAPNKWYRLRTPRYSWIQCNYTKRILQFLLESLLS